MSWNKIIFRLLFDAKMGGLEAKKQNSLYTCCEIRSLSVLRNCFDNEDQTGSKNYPQIELWTLRGRTFECLGVFRCIFERRNNQQEIMGYRLFPRPLIWLLCLCFGLLVCRFVALWLCGFVALWVYFSGFVGLGVWVFKCLRVCASVCLFVGLCVCGFVWLRA